MQQQSAGLKYYSQFLLSLYLSLLNLKGICLDLLIFSDKMYFLLISLFCITAVLSHDLAQAEARDEVTDPKVEKVKQLTDGENILSRSRRSAKAILCKYKKGNWSQCDKKVMVSKDLTLQVYLGEES